MDPWEGKVRLGRIVLNAATAAVHDDSEPDLQRVNAILACEAFVSKLADAGCMVTRIPEDLSNQPQDDVLHEDVAHDGGD